MKKKKSYWKIFLAVFLLIMGIAVAHFVVFPQQTRSLLIGFSTFKRTGDLYYNHQSSVPKIDSVKAFIEKGKSRIIQFWGEQKSRPRFIYCEKEEDFQKYGNSFPVPALTHIKLGACIVISEDGLDQDIIAHEMMHAELYERIGFYKWAFKIPRWFDEGLAMQIDFRNYYSEDTLKIKSDNFRNLPDLKSLDTGEQFNKGSREQVMLNYMTAAHVIRKWYSKQHLQKFIESLNNGKSFEVAYNQ